MSLIFHTAISRPIPPSSSQLSVIYLLCPPCLPYIQQSVLYYFIPFTFNPFTCLSYISFIFPSFLPVTSMSYTPFIPPPSVQSPVFSIPPSSYPTCHPVASPPYNSFVLCLSTVYPIPPHLSPGHLSVLYFYCPPCFPSGLQSVIHFHCPPHLQSGLLSVQNFFYLLSPPTCHQSALNYLHPLHLPSSHLWTIY